MTLRTVRIACLATTAAVSLACSALAGCGGSDCAGVITINATPEECQRQAERFGCTGVDVEGPSCGLYGCASCDGTDS